MKYLCVLILFIVWLLWATFSTSALYDLKQINPDYPVRNKSLANLVSKLNYFTHHKWDINHAWDSYHVETCSPYMPNWKKAEECVTVRTSCEYESPKDLSGGADIFSKKYIACYIKNRPAFGITEWLHISRSFFRVGISQAALRLSDADREYKKGNQEEWDKTNRWWAQPLVEWIEQSL